MCQAEVTAISLVTEQPRTKVCGTIIPYVGRALSNQSQSYQRMPLTRDYIDWVVNDRDQLTVALDEVNDTCIILVATRGEDTEQSASRLIKIASEMISDYDVRTVFWNGSETPIAAQDFLHAPDVSSVSLLAKNRIVPRRVHAKRKLLRADHQINSGQINHWLLQAMRCHVLTSDPDETEMQEIEERRARTAPMRLSAWALSFATALIATPLAIPLLVHNLVRGEDVKSGALSLGVAGLYAALVHTGMAPGLAMLL